MMICPSPPPPPKGTSPRSSPRASPKSGIRLFPPKSNSFKSLLLGLIAFSSVTNLLFWRHRIGVGLDPKDGDWDTIPRETEIDQKIHVRIKRGRQYSATRQTNNSRDRRRYGHVGQQQVLQKHHHTQSTVPSSGNILVEVTTLASKSETDNTMVAKDSSIRRSDNTILNNKIEHLSRGGKRRLPFRPHPNKKDGRFLSLPKPTESIKLHRLVYLDGNAEISVAHNFLHDWITTNNTDDEGDASEDGNSVQRSQTVVWDDDEQCIPMSEWQTSIHVRARLFLLLRRICISNRPFLSVYSTAVL